MHTYLVKENRLLSPTTQLLTLELEESGHPLLFEPGQYAAISFKSRRRPTVMRCFSITSSPTDQQTLQFSMRVKGRFTKAIQKIEVGETVNVMGPFGGFVLPAHDENETVLLAGGIGIAPFISMIRYNTIDRTNRPLKLIYSCQTQEDVPFLDDLKELDQLNSALSVDLVIGKEPIDKLKDITVFTGMLDASLLTRLKLNYSKSRFYICGPPPYMKAVSQLLISHGVEGNRIFTEAFSQGSKKQSGAIKSWPFNIYALTGLSLAVGGFAIMALDLSKTLPTLNKKSEFTSSSPNAIINNGAGDELSSVNSVKPQVDTNTKQADKIIGTTGTTTPSYASPNTYTPPKTTTVAPTPTTTTSPPPTTTVS